MTKIYGYRGESLLGHNGGPSLDENFGWRRHCWKAARAELLGPRLPVEIIRRRVLRAKELGLAYPQYASILLGSGRDIVGFLFTCEAMGLRLARQLEMPRAVQAQLGALVGCDRLAIAPEAEDPQAFRAELQLVSGLSFAAAGRPPRPAAAWRESRSAIREVVAGAGLVPGAVVMIGTRGTEADWAEAAALARFLPAESYFGSGPAISG